MRFSLKSNLVDKFTDQQVKSKIRLAARKYVILSAKRASEIALNHYLVEKYQNSLEGLCLKIIYNCKMSIEKDKEIVITLNNYKLDQIAELITFGTGKIPGSQILVNAFKVLENK